MRIKNFNRFEMITEAAARMPVSEAYWKAKGKIGKKVALYTHDDLDGIFSAVEMKNWLQKQGFKIEKYGILNYSDGWKYTTLDPTLINVVLDFANMPGDERDELIDFYLDHHGDFTPEQKEKYKNSPVIKKHTASAYEAVLLALDLPQDELKLNVIDMVDAAKYDEYQVTWQRLLNFDLPDIIRVAKDAISKKEKGKHSFQGRLEFAAAFNQFLKRSDTKTIISVIENCKDASIYAIYNIMSKVSPYHNIPKRGPMAGEIVDFRTDAQERLAKMQRMTRGTKTSSKKIYQSMDEFLKDFKSGYKIDLSGSGYQIIGKLAFVPTGTWANALRARSIIEKDFMEGIIESEPDFILLQYGGTLQVCSYKKMSEIENLPILKDGTIVNDLGSYMTGLLNNFRAHLDYYDPDTTIGQDEITVSGGHGGIGSISNIFGECKVGKHSGSRFIDMFKNKIISDLSGVKFDIDLKWGEKSEGTPKEPDSDYKVIPTEKITKIDKYGNVYIPERVMTFKSFNRK
jgi:hypothetical protein